ncbi:hypothetical protein ACMU_03910 [Actibacterium mucosum KCTC 23349]|uniref:Fatty acid desaturase domain-containing protein n=1 Tax=Actibacterium mucosum KCTC 23349 TaxID=1454373 RepID=A0A037ZEK3_9RHOB|nr:fatty acid desaturase [Actibacterium mucosum]KAJ54048.1 hypothetical protein ACMU_03910 [Actibacterium mucosum KCTC 23349]
MYREKAPNTIHWKDLTEVTPWQRINEILLPLPWLMLSWWLYAGPAWPLGAAASFMYFLCALRLNHEAIHGNLGLPRWGDNLILYGLSALMGGSNHTVAYCHMVHHRHAMGPEDHEGKCGHMTLGQVILYGPQFPLDQFRAAWEQGGIRWRRRIVADWVCIIGFAALCLWLGWQFLILHVVAMVVAQCFTALFAVWITHQGTVTHGLAGRSQRGPLARLAYLMFYHREHHLFPNVPVRRLPELADRLDTEVAGYAASRMPVIPALDRNQ